MDDWKYEKQWYNKQGKLLEWLCSIKIEPKKKKEIKLKRDRSEKKWERIIHIIKTK